MYVKTVWADYQDFVIFAKTNCKGEDVNENNNVGYDGFGHNFNCKQEIFKYMTLLLEVAIDRMDA